MDPRALAAELIVDPDIEGVTVSGGEPTEQPDAVADLLEAFRAVELDTWVYTGHRFEDLVGRNSPAVDRLLALTDVLVDGPYVLKLACSGDFRGSRNQRMLPLSLAGSRRLENLGRARLAIELERDGLMRITGVPPCGFLDEFTRRLESKGLVSKAVQDLRNVGECGR